MAFGKNGNSGSSPKENSSAASVQKTMEELAFLRQQFNSLSLRGHYSECAKLIESNLKRMYTYERWPENFFSVLLVHKRCYPSLNQAKPYEEYLTDLLQKQDIPSVFSEMTRGGGRSAVWTADHFKETAVLCQKSGDFSRGLGYVDLLIKVSPASSGARVLRGWLLEGLSRNSEALAMYEEALELNPGNKQADESIAKFYVNNDAAKAMDYINKALEKDPESPLYLSAKAALLEKNGSRQQALEVYDQAMSADPYNADYPYEKAELLLQDDNRMAAITLYKRALALNERHVPTLSRLARLFEKKEPGLALVHVATLVYLEPDNMEYALLRAKLLRRTGDFENAIVQYKHILEKDENNPQAIAGLGQLYLKQDAVRALDYFNQAVELSPQEPLFHLGKADAHLLLQQNDEAIEAYKASSQLDPQNHRPLGRLGRLFLQSDIKAALDYFNRALRLSPKNSDYYNDKATVLLQIPGRRQEAVDCLVKASTYDPGNAQLHTRLALLLGEDNNRASALLHYREAVNIDPDIANAHYGIAVMLTSTEPHTALSAINAAIGLDSVNGAYYYQKSLILCRLKQNSYAINQLEQQLAAGSEEQQAELSGLLKGDSLRSALLAVNRAIELSPNNNLYLCQRANLLQQMGQEAKAREQYLQLIKQDADNHPALYGMGRLLAEKKDKKALEYFDKAIALSPRSAEYHGAKASFLAEDEATWREAVACYDTAIPLDTYAWEPVLERAQLLDTHGENLLAQGGYRRTLLIYRDCLPATTRLGQLLSESNPTAAAVYIKHAIKLEPENPGHYPWLSRAMYNLGKEEEAEAACTEALRLGDSSPQIHYQLARGLMGVRNETAIRYCQEAIEVEPQCGEYPLLCADLWLEQEQAEPAMECLQLAKANGAEPYDVSFKLGRLLSYQKNIAALEELNAALAVRPDSVEALSLKARVLSDLAQPPRIAEAIACLDQAIKLDSERIILREQLVELLQRNRSLLRLPVEKIKLDRLRRKWDQILAAEADQQELIFEEEPNTEADQTQDEKPSNPDEASVL